MTEISILSQAADLASAILSATDGDWVSAGLSLGAMAPGGGSGATVVKWGRKGLKMGDTVGAGAKLGGGKSAIRSGEGVGGKLGNGSGGRLRSPKDTEGEPEPPEGDDDNSEYITFYRGERAYVADEVVASQMWDLGKLAELQRNRQYDGGLYLTTQLNTAIYFGDVGGVRKVMEFSK